MTSHPKCALAAGLLSLALASGCTPVQPVAYYTGTTPPIPAQEARVRYVYCVTAPKGYVVPQDKWDPYLVPCPVRVAPVSTPSRGSNDGSGPVQPDRPTPPPEPRQPSHEGSSAGDASASVTRNQDGTTTETSTAGSATATVTY